MWSTFSFLSLDDDDSDDACDDEKNTVSIKKALLL